jgi:hypothetical protein
MAARPRFGKYFFGWLGVLVDVGCLLYSASLIWDWNHNCGCDYTRLGILSVIPFLLGIIVVATVISVLCFKSLHKHKAWSAETHGKHGSIDVPWRHVDR